MDNSILDSIKRLLGVDPSYTAFDTDIIMHINTAFAVMTQLGIGPVQGFAIEDASSEWDEFVGDDLNLNMVKTCVGLRVRMAFDPPATSYAIAAVEKQIEELTWRINVYREATKWSPPVIPPLI